MSTAIVCYNCNHSLADLSLPFSRRDMCPSCSVHLHVCRMCVAYDPAVLRQCREDEADDVLDKERVNFCDWFEPAAGAYSGAHSEERDRARANLESLFDGTSSSEAGVSGNTTSNDAEKLFK